MEKKFFLGVDVGTSSVRCALVDHHGKVIGHASKTIQIWNETEVMVVTLKQIRITTNNPQIISGNPYVPAQGKFF
jgi:ribulose kinase